MSLKTYLQQPEKAEEAINYLMDEFDFDTVHRVMKFLNWTWTNANVPTVGNLRRIARGMIKEVIENGDLELHTGGFVVTFYEGEIRLMFNVDTVAFDCVASDYLNEEEKEL